jgi:alpha-tubulin suppressor-like RCC1 family protein
MSSRDQAVAMLDVLDKSEGRRRKIIAAGKNRFGVLAQGDDVKDSKVFKDIKINFNLVQVVDIQMTTTFGMAITKEGTIYGWGKNDNNSLGLDDKFNSKVIGTPSPIEAFSDYIVKKISCGKIHSLIYAKKTKNNKELETSCLFCLGTPEKQDGSFFGISKD